MAVRSIYLLLLFTSLISKSLIAQAHYALIVSGESEGRVEKKIIPCISENLWQYTFITWEYLILNKNIKKENITVLYGQGSDWSDLNPMLRNTRYESRRFGLERITDYASDTINLNMVVNKLRQSIKENDSLTVHFIFYSSRENTSHCSELFLNTGSIYTSSFISCLRQLAADCEIFWISTPNCSAEK